MRSTVLVDCFAINTEKYLKKMKKRWRKEGGILFIPDAFPNLSNLFRPIGSLTLLSGKCDYQICFPISTYILPCSLSILTRDNGATMPRKWRLLPWKFAFQGTTNVGKVAINCGRETRAPLPLPLPSLQPIVCFGSIPLIFGKRVVRDDRVYINFSYLPAPLVSFASNFDQITRSRVLN